METVRRYSKSSAFYLNMKRDFFGNNDALLEQAERQNTLYAAQPRRAHCKICEGAMPPHSDFGQHGVEYAFCMRCGHLNGLHEEAEEFVSKLYISDSGKDYAKNYLDEDFLNRINQIYLPKVDFLLDHLHSDGASLLDVGCGAGYFVYASIQRGISATGIDVGKAMIDYGNRQISHLAKDSPLTVCEERALFDAVRTTDAQIVSALGVIEHLREPHEFFHAFRESRARYLYYLVPMFSLSVVLENVFPNVFPRVLSGGHTHLFTDSSVRKMNEIISVTPIAEWRFGTDIMDLYRSIVTTALGNGASTAVREQLDAGFGMKIDELQAVMDQNHFCSELHLLAEKT